MTTTTDTDTLEYTVIRSCRMDLTKKLTKYYKEVARYLCQSGELTDRQCQTITFTQNPEDGAERLVEMIFVDINDPNAALNTFANFVKAIKQNGNEAFKTFVEDKLEVKRKELYRKLLIVPPDFVASQKYDVFISYSQEDSTKGKVDTLMSRLKDEGLTVFVDRSALHVGDNWKYEIASAIHTCKVFVCVFTKRYMCRKYCSAELYEAEALRKPLFPVVCEDGWRDVPGGTLVTDVVGSIHRVSLMKEEDRETQLTELVDSIKGKLQKELV